ncbi:MAG: hypothetical protein KDC98_07220, partial [Planctomycetes bacterium]|nr:hypothetical protein [Planctomycetota bacterium]
RVSNAAASFGCSPAQPLTVSDSRFDSCTTANTGGTGQVEFSNCCIPNGLFYGTATSTVRCTDCFLYQNPTGSFVTEVTPRPAEQLGSMHVLPAVPTIGSTVTFQAELPTGLVGFFLLGFTDVYPPFPWGQPMHVYGQLSNTFVLPGTYRLQQSYLWALPNWPILIGLDVVAQIAVLPDPGVSAQPVQLAPGRRFAVQ